MADAQQNLNPRFINNIANGEDRFAGKSQEKLAAIITETISSEPMIKIIGIEGGWGTGKSNLIELIRKSLKSRDNNKYHFFIYDVWGHQEDLQRRSFLEELTTYLTLDQPILSNQTDWKKRLKALLAKSREVTTKTVPSLSIGIAATTLAIITTPLFHAISEQIEDDKIKILVTGLPLIILLITIGGYYQQNLDRTKGFKDNFKRTIKTVFRIYQEAQTENTNYEIISEDEPSVAKFRQWMTDISDDLGEKQLVIVFDNMDRLPKEKIVQLWSSIHTFFAEKGYKNIKVLIPFDRENIQHAFKDGDRTRYAEDYINKTFDAVYRVSPPILSDWKQFFEEKWIEAFGEKGVEFDRVLQVFDHLATSKTPRDIVVYINDFVSTIQINFEVPYRYVALFLAAKTKILADPETSILSPEYLGSLNFLYADDEELSKNIAALIYQISPSKSIEVVFTGKLVAALNNNDINSLQAISSEPTFQHILSATILQVENFENSILCLENISDKIEQITWDDIYSKFGKQEQKLKDAKVKPFQIILLDRLSAKPSYLKELINKLANSEGFEPVDYYLSVENIRDRIKSNNLDMEIDENLHEILTTAEKFVEVVKIAKDGRFNKLKTTTKELNDYLSLDLSSPTCQESGYVARIPSEYELTDLTKAIKVTIKDEETDVERCADLHFFYKNASRNRVMETVLTDDDIESFFTETSEEDSNGFYYDLICMRISRLNKFVYPGATIDDILENDDEKLVEEVTKRIQNFITFGNFLLGIKLLDKPLTIAVVKELTEGNYSLRSATIQNVLKEIDLIQKITNLPFGSLIKRLNEWPETVVKADKIQEILPNVNFFEACVTIDNRLATHCKQLGVDYLKDQTAEYWKKELLAQKSPIISVALLIILGQFSSTIFGAVKEVLLQIVKQETPIPNPIIWQKILAKSHAASVRATMKDIRDIFNSSHEITADLFKFLGNYLFQSAELESKPDTLRRIFNKQILVNEGCIEIALIYPEQLKEIFNNSPDKDSFRFEVQGILKNETEQLNKLSGLLGITSASESSVA